MRKVPNEDLERLLPDEYRQATKLPVVLVLDNIRSLNNIGSVFRTADAFRVEKIFLCGITATPPHRDIHKTALGATESVPWEYSKATREAVEQLKAMGYSILAIEQAEGSVMLNELRLDRSGKFALVFGSEVGGVADDVLAISDMAVEIPQFGTKHSLNIAVSAGVVIWQMFLELGLE